MKTKLTIAIICFALSVAAKAQSFNATVLDLQSGKMSVINGNINNDEDQTANGSRKSTTKIYQDIAESAKARKLRLREETDRVNAEITASQQLYELQEQTRLLRKIADK